MAWDKQDRSFKTLINRQTTNNVKAFYEELGADTINVAMREVWVDNVNTDPSVAITDGKAQLYTLYVLTEDTSVPAQQAYNTNGLTDWISPKFGPQYEVKLYDNANNQIFPTNASGWFFDYQTGILTFSGSTASFPKPFKITGYRYIGNKGKVVASIEFISEEASTSGESGLLIHYSNGETEFITVAASGGPVGPVSGLKAEYVFAHLNANVPSVIDYSGLGFTEVAAVQFFELISGGTSGTSGDDILQAALVDFTIDELTQTIIVNPTVTVDVFLHIIGPGDITLVTNINNATTTKRGVVEIATQFEFDNSIDVGGSGAILSVPPSMIKNAIADVNYLILPPPINSVDDYGIIGNWSYDDNFIYFCIPCSNGTSGQCAPGGKVWRRIAVETW